MRKSVLPLAEEQLNELAEQEARFFAGVSEIYEETFGIFLANPAFPHYGSANRVLRLRDDGRGAAAVADAVLRFYRERELLASVDLDSVAESQGIGSALRQRGLNSAVTNRLLMHYAATAPPSTSSLFPIRHIPNDSGSGEAKEWLDISLSQENDEVEATEWREILRHDVRQPSHQLYVACENETAASCCQLFSHHGYGRIDDVLTRPEYRGRGLALAVVAHAVSVSLESGNHTTFLYCEANSPAERLYRKLGFIAWERNPFRRHFTPSP